MYDPAPIRTYRRRQRSKNLPGNTINIKDWSSGEYLYLAMDGQEMFEDGRSYHYEYTPLLQGGKFLSESGFSPN